jgi:cyclic pyranopterin phosphate synthase
MKGVNEDQVLPLLEYSAERDISIRYLEVMKMGHMQFRHSEFFVSEEEILNQIRTQYVYVPLERVPGSTANYWITNDMKKFGIIANTSSPFCHDCDRLRLDSNGNIYGCLSNNRGINIMDGLNNSFELESRLKIALAQKQMEFKGSIMSMKSIGG